MNYSVYVRRYERRKRIRRARNISDLLCMAGFMAALIAGCMAECEDLTAFAITGCIALICMAAGGYLYGAAGRMRERRDI